MHLHNYQLVIRTSQATVKVCKECKKRTVFRKDRAGRMDNRKYYKAHKRDFLQKGDKYYNRFYGQEEN